MSRSGYGRASSSLSGHLSPPPPPSTTNGDSLSVGGYGGGSGNGAASPGGGNNNNSNNGSGTPPVLGSHSHPNFAAIHREHGSVDGKSNNSGKKSRDFSPSGNSAKNVSRDVSVEGGGRNSDASSRTGSPVGGGGGGNPNKSSKKVLNHWKQAASMSKLGKGTRNLLGKWKSSHSQSMDVPSSMGDHHHHHHLVNSGNAVSMGSDPCVLESLHSTGSTDIPDNGGGAAAKNAKAQWSEHVWTAWVHRGFCDDVTEVRTVQPGGDLLTEFQKDKFRYFFFHVLDLNSDYVISAEDFEKLNERIRHYMDWSVNSIQYLAMKEVHSTFLECFLKTAANFSKQDDGKEKTRNPELMFEHWKLGFPIGSILPLDHRFDYWDPFKKLDALYDKMENVTLTDVLNDEPEVEMKTCVTIDEWIDVWGTLVGNKKRLDDLPMWLQYYPKILFDVINRAGTGVITKSELKYFYTAFMDVGKLGEEKLDEMTHNAFHALTSGGDTKLNYHIFKLSFLNFLLGKQPNGPGQFLFGTVTPRNTTCMFPIDYSAMNAAEEDLEPFRPNKLEEKGSRRSVLV